MNFIGSLCESKLFPSKQHLDRYTARELADILYLYICALTVMMTEPVANEWAMSYCRKTVQHGEAMKWHSDSTDMEIMIWLLSRDDLGYTSFNVDTSLFCEWLHKVSSKHDRTLSERFLLRLDGYLKVKASDLKSIRRKSMHSSGLGIVEKRNLLSDIHRKLVRMAPRCELLATIEQAIGEAKSSVDETFIQSLMREDASAGATSAGDVAAVVKPLGAVIRRNPTNELVASVSTKKLKKVNKDTK